MTLGIGVIGVGLLGRRHAENVARLGGKGRLVAVADVNATAAEAVGRDLGCDWSTDPYQLIERPDIQAVIIVTGADTHASLTIAAADRGKDVFCEKPLAPTIEEAQAAVEAVNRAGVRLQIGFMRRYDPSYREAYEAIERGEIGRPVLFTAVSRDAEPPPRAYFSSPGAGSIFLDSGIHDFDLARWLMGDEVRTVSASGALLACHDLADVQPVDLGLATLTFQNGTVGTVEIYRRALYGYDIRTEVVGTEGAVRIGDQSRYPVHVLHPTSIAHIMAHHWLDRFRDAYALEIEDWASRMAGDRPAAVTGEDGIRSVAIAIAAETSRQTGRSVEL